MRQSLKSSWRYTWKNIYIEEYPKDPIEQYQQEFSEVIPSDIPCKKSEGSPAEMCGGIPARNFELIPARICVKILPVSDFFE